MSADGDPGALAQAAHQLGDAEALDLLAALVSIAPTNLEDPVRERYDKPNYRRAIDQIVRTARRFGLETRTYDPVERSPHPEEFRGIPRPNAVIDLVGGRKERVLILAHYDVVPVPAEQLARWRSPPHTLTARSDGRLYGRGSNDDLGSGVVASLLAMRRMADHEANGRSVRLLVCCDEETGGEGGVESLKAHDQRLAEDDPERFLTGAVALIPDGSPHVTAGSSGVAFLDATAPRPVPTRSALRIGEVLRGLNRLARGWRSAHASPDWPEHGAPERVITGRATVTKLDLVGEPTASSKASVEVAHAESDAANQIARAVTVVLAGSEPAQASASDQLRRAVRDPFRLEPVAGTAVVAPKGSTVWQIVGQSAHGGYPHLGHNPVEEALRVLELGTREAWLDAERRVRVTYAVDLRLTPEMALDDGLRPALAVVREAFAAEQLEASIEAPPARCRPGYSMSPQDTWAVRLERILTAEGGEPGVFGEYGGTDASSLLGLRSTAGGPLPAIVFGSMDRNAHIHDAEESVDPRLIAAVSRSIERFVTEG